MTYIAKPRLHHPLLQPNALGFTRRDYEGKVSTLCAGCGHDSISAAIIQAAFELDLPPHRLAKLRQVASGVRRRRRTIFSATRTGSTLYTDGCHQCSRAPTSPTAS